MEMKVIAILLISLHCHGLSGVDTDRVSVSVMEGDSVTLHTGVKTDQQETIVWFFNNTRIAKINGDQSKICTDVQCNEGTERFRDRLKLDHQTGSLTITNTRKSDSDEYKLKIISGSSDSEKIFSVTVHGVSAAERDEVERKSVKEGESVTLDPSVSSVNPMVSVSAVPDSGLSAGAIAGISVAVVISCVILIAGAIYKRHQDRKQHWTGRSVGL